MATKPLLPAVLGSINLLARIYIVFLLGVKIATWKDVTFHLKMNVGIAVVKTRLDITIKRQ